MFSVSHYLPPPGLSPSNRGLSFQADLAPSLGELGTHQPGVELGGNLESMSHRCQVEEVVFVWELINETIHLPLGCLQGGVAQRRDFIELECNALGVGVHAAEHTRA